MSAAERTIAVVGGGLMGHGLAQAFLEAGRDVALFEPDADVRASVPQRIARNLADLGRDDAVLARLRLCDQLASAVAEAELAIEAGPEDLAVKRAIFAQLDAAAPRDAILATNTSVIAIGEIAAGAPSGRERVVGTHWWNPPYLVPLVEVVPGPETAPETVERTLALLRAAGKQPVRVARDVPGFIGNRLQHALWREAFALVDGGVCDADTVDEVVKAGFGRRLAVLGPMENADLVGLDLTLAIHDYLLPTLSPPSDPSPGLRERVARGENGMASGAGWRAWADGDRERAIRRVNEHLAAAS